LYGAIGIGDVVLKGTIAHSFPLLRNLGDMTITGPRFTISGETKSLKSQISILLCSG